MISTKRAPRKRLSKKGVSSRAKAEALVGLVAQKKSRDIIALDVSGSCAYADYFIICSGHSSRQVQAIAEHVHAEAKQLGFYTLGQEGVKEGTWALLDFNDVIIHIFYDEVRSFYDLEGLWSEADRLDLSQIIPPEDLTGDDDEGEGDEED
ncbi:MAG: ribosome silencing factor [Deltaproteobacteria bacterium]|nr:ribosome silencing factor [Deltaproteobacteria bacterium]